MRANSLVILLVAALSSAGAAQVDLDGCLEQFDLTKVYLQTACLEQILAAGPDAVARLVAAKKLTETQPTMTIVHPANRLKLAVTSLDFVLKISNPTPAPALVRTVSLQPSMSVAFQSFGFTWDAGLSSAQTPEMMLQRAADYVLLNTDESVELSYKVPVEMKLAGRYVFTYQFSYDRQLTIPQADPPGWPQTGSFTIDYLPESVTGKSGPRPIGKGDLKIQVSSSLPVSAADSPFTVDISVRNPSPKDKVLLPDSRSFFGAPFWYVILGRDATNRDQIICMGNLVSMEEMVTEPSSIDVKTQRLDEQKSFKLSSKLQLRLPAGDYAGIVGCTVFRDAGSQGFWIGEAASSDFSFTLIPK